MTKVSSMQRDKLAAAASAPGVWPDEYPEMSGCGNRHVVSRDVMIRGVAWLLISWTYAEGDEEIRAIRYSDARRVAAWGAKTRRGRTWIEAAFDHAAPLSAA